MNFPYLLQMMQQRISGCDWQHGDPVFLSFTTADGDLPGPQIDILHAQTQGFQQSQARPVEQQGCQSRRARHAPKKRSHLVAGEHHREPLGFLCTHDAIDPVEFLLEHHLIEKEEGRKSLVLSGG